MILIYYSIYGVYKPTKISGGVPHCSFYYFFPIRNPNSNHLWWDWHWHWSHHPSHWVNHKPEKDRSSSLGRTRRHKGHRVGTFSYRNGHFFQVGTGKSLKYYYYCMHFEYICYIYIYVWYTYIFAYHIDIYVIIYIIVYLMIYLIIYTIIYLVIYNI